MIIETNQDSLDSIVSFAWDIAKNKSKCGFPRFASLEQLSTRFKRTLQHPEDKLLAYYENNTLIGVLNLYVEAENKYLQAIGGIMTKSDFSFVANQFINYLTQLYPGYEFNLGFPKEYDAANQYLNEIHAQPMDASVTMKLTRDQFVRNSPTHTIVPLNQSHHEAYAAFHDFHNPTMYWCSQRIYEKLDIWDVFICQDHDKMIGSIFIKQCLCETHREVFGLSIDPAYQNKGLELALLSESLYHILTPSVVEVLFFVDDGDTATFEATIKSGFKQIDTYRSYKIIL